MRAFLGVIAAFAVSRVTGYSMYAMRVPNGDKVPGVTALGHLDPILAGPMNEFGMDMIDADFHWTKEFCMKDSDGDGQTNGQELGDPCCEFVHRKNPKVRWTEGVSHPGDASLKSDPKLWEGIVCEETAANTSVDAGQEAKTEAVEKTTVQAETVTEDTEEPVKVSSQKTEGANETAEEEAPTAAKDEAEGAAPALFSSSLLSAVVLLGLLAFVAVRMRRRRSQWTLLPQQGRRTQ
ncbi:Temptin [Phytophthora citrophthora]|uniref:Temptin n=1 Tax=Phytophthora citrophthora TaxID=4793 RepID=A0AAD9LFX0_9STRA|nr:Temptin [Phytophthora citrophthora]